MSASVGKKYANLPDIDTEQPDVYETPDVADETPSETEAEEEVQSAEISTEAMGANVAAARFRASAGDVDSETALARYQRSLFRTLQLESLADGATTGPRLQETAAQRLQRLTHETQELRDQLAAAEGTQNSVALMELATNLHDELARLTTQGESHGALAALLRRVESAQITDSAAPKPVAQRATHGGTKADDSAQLEQRIVALERLVGAGAGHPARDAATGHGLADAVARLRQQMDVLADPQRIDGIQRRAKQALVEMDRLEAARSQAARADAADPADTTRVDAATLRRVDELYDTMSSVDSLVELAPATAARLQSLATLHAEATEAVSRIARVDSAQTNISEELATMRDVAAGLSSSLHENSSTLSDNVRHLDARISALNDRIAALPQ
ncbi:hypothetical protein H4S08_002823 [Coemansia sp. RSA 1365]|nr:hypothetical protein H4S08_002823 [Coemansia sp. RSA 1365]